MHLCTSEPRYTTHALRKYLAGRFEETNKTYRAKALKASKKIINTKISLKIE